MAASPTLRPGATYSDVAAHPSGLVWAYCLGSDVVVELNLQPFWRLTLPEIPMELSVACAPWGEVRTLLKGNASGEIYEVSEFGWLRHGPGYGVQGQLLRWDGYRFVAYIFRAADHFGVLNLESGIEAGRMYPFGSTSQGFLDVVDGVPIFTDLGRLETVGGLTLTLPQTRGEVTIGQLGDPTVYPDQIAGVCTDATGQYPFTALDGPGYEPRLCQLDIARYAVCARTPTGAALVVLPPWPPLVTRPAPDVPPVVVPPQPVDPPLPTPKEPHVSTQAEWSRWMNDELPLLRRIYTERHGGQAPGEDWYPFVTARRGVTVPEGPWPWEQLLAFERSQGDAPEGPQPTSTADTSG